MERREGRLASIGEIIERNIELSTLDPVARGGFTQVPNFILRDGTLSLGAKVRLFDVPAFRLEQR
jgi:hypothetical protein